MSPLDLRDNGNQTTGSSGCRHCAVQSNEVLRLWPRCLVSSIIMKQNSYFVRLQEQKLWILEKLEKLSCLFFTQLSIYSFICINYRSVGSYKMIIIHCDCYYFWFTSCPRFGHHVNFSGFWHILTCFGNFLDLWHKIKLILWFSSYCTCFSPLSRSSGSL